MGSLLLHETAHLWMLRKLGDKTAQQHGFKNINPIKLIDPWGTVLIPIVTLLSSSFLFHIPLLFGWARPVPVDFNKLPDPKKDAASVALAGPAVNLLAAAMTGAALWVLPSLDLISGTGTLAYILSNVAKINLALAVFNLIPLPSLDGGKLLVRFLPAKYYNKWVHNPKLPTDYQGIFRRLYEGPSNLLSRLHVHGQPVVNNITRAVSLVALAGFYAITFNTLGAPLLFMMLVCSYDYYCIREKMQNEAAVNALIDIIQAFSADIAKMAEDDDSILSEINSEEIEHVIKNVLEDILDKVVDSENFDELTDEAKWSRFEAIYKEELIPALKTKGMSEDTPETIRRVIESEQGRKYFGNLKNWIHRNQVWERWRSPNRKEKLRDNVKEAPKDKKKSVGGGDGTGTMLGMLGLLGAGTILHGLTGVPGGDIFSILGMGLPFLALTIAGNRSPPNPIDKIEARDGGEIYQFSVFFPPVTSVGTIDEIIRRYGTPGYPITRTFITAEDYVHHIDCQVIAPSSRNASGIAVTVLALATEDQVTKITVHPEVANIIQASRTHSVSTQQSRPEDKIEPQNQWGYHDHNKNAMIVVVRQGVSEQETREYLNNNGINEHNFFLRKIGDNDYNLIFVGIEIIPMATPTHLNGTAQMALILAGDERVTKVKVHPDVATLAQNQQAPNLSKIRAGAPNSNPNTFEVKFRDDRNATPSIVLWHHGITNLTSIEATGDSRTRIYSDSPAQIAQQAAGLAGEESVEYVIVHPNLATELGIPSPPPDPMSKIHVEHGFAPTTITLWFPENIKFKHAKKVLERHGVANYRGERDFGSFHFLSFDATSVEDAANKARAMAQETLVTQIHVSPAAGNILLPGQSSSTPDLHLRSIVGTNTNFNVNEFRVDFQSGTADFESILRNRFGLVTGPWSWTKRHETSYIITT
ncbi:MAG: site-2 protease family protein, partial [Elusimicrobia bacterium]|nr:site-2 protease family protein [Elusimicrobiota bacterium]